MVLFFVISAESEENEKPVVLWVMYFNMRDTSGLDNNSYNLPSNVHVCTGPDDSLGCDYSIKLVSSHEIIKELGEHAIQVD